ncbi:MAG: hypothetical protein WCF04_15115 [Candidatus Nanopelagicales bacterium]
MRLHLGGAGLAVVAAAALSGCSVSPTSYAAVSDTFRITQQEISADVAEVLQAAGRPPAETAVGLALTNVQRRAQDALVAAEAELLGVRVTQKQVEDGLAALAEEKGGMDVLADAAVQSGIPPSALEDYARTNLLITEIGRAMKESGGSGSLEDTRVALAGLSKSIGIEVAPRYGTWDHEAVGITPGSTVAVPSGSSAG